MFYGKKFFGSETFGYDCRIGFKRQKHEAGQRRKQKDHGGEKGDVRRKGNPNKRRTMMPISVEDYGDVVIVAGVCIIVGTIIEDVVTGGIGVADDVSSIALGIDMIISGGWR